MIAVPAPLLAATIEQCIEKRVRGAVVVTNVDDVPEVDVTAIVAHARRNGLRIIGPGSMGIASPRDDIALQAALADVRLPPGNVAISLQSGTLGSAVLQLADHVQLPDLVVRLARHQGRCVGQRPAPVLGRRRGDER